MYEINAQTMYSVHVSIFFLSKTQKLTYLMEWRSIGRRRRRGRETSSQRSDTLQNGGYTIVGEFEKSAALEAFVCNVI